MSFPIFLPGVAGWLGVNPGGSGPHGIDGEAHHEKGTDGMQVTSFHHTAGGIDWYCEQSGSGPVVVLIPSGEGDCGNFRRTAEHLADQFTVLTFDTPGYSRTGLPEDPEDVSLPKLGGQIAALLQSLNFGPVTIYGCSSGGRAVLDLVSTSPNLVLNALVHEAALPSVVLDQLLGRLVALDDAGVTATCQELFAKLMNEDESAWEALGAEYHERLARNYVTWVRRYIAPGVGKPIDPESLRGLPITWTVGSLTETIYCQSNIDLAGAAGLDIGTLPCRHFPQVSIPDRLASHIAAATRPYLESRV